MTLTNDSQLLGADWSVYCGSALPPGTVLPPGETGRFVRHLYASPHDELRTGQYNKLHTKLCNQRHRVCGVLYRTRRYAETGNGYALRFRNRRPQQGFQRDADHWRQSHHGRFCSGPAVHDAGRRQHII